VPAPARSVTKAGTITNLQSRSKKSPLKWVPK